MILLLFVLLLAIVVGFEIISRVPSILHTPLMSATNAISGITIVGAIIIMVTSQINDSHMTWILGSIAIFFAMINVVGGYVVTDRMLKMFKKKEKKAHE